MSAVTKEDVARLHAYLIVPVAVSDALMDATPIDGETQYGLHVALSEIDPDSALLAIALSAYRIAQDFTGDIPVASALKLEADRIINDYAPDWLAHYHSHPVQGDDLYNLLSHVPEDLESVSDLLESLQASIRDENHPAHTLCSVLSIQARAHMEIADYVLTEIEKEDCSAFACDEDFDGVCKVAPETVLDGSNIILFPVHRCR